MPTAKKARRGPDEMFSILRVLWLTCTHRPIQDRPIHGIIPLGNKFKGEDIRMMTPILNIRHKLNMNALKVEPKSDSGSRPITRSSSSSTLVYDPRTCRQLEAFVNLKASFPSHNPAGGEGSCSSNILNSQLTWFASAIKLGVGRTRLEPYADWRLRTSSRNKWKHEPNDNPCLPWDLRFRLTSCESQPHPLCKQNKKMFEIEAHFGKWRDCYLKPSRRDFWDNLFCARQKALFPRSGAPSQPLRRWCKWSI